jgi:hypothetical protein
LLCPASAVLPVEGLVHRFLIGKVDLRTHRPHDPVKRRWTSLSNFAVVQSLGEEIRDEAAERFAFSLLAAFEIPQNGRVNIDRRSRHDEMMINFYASDVKLPEGRRGNHRLPTAASFVGVTLGSTAHNPSSR